MTRIVALDIETAPAIVFAFGGFKVNISMDQIIEHPRMIGFSYQWEGSKTVGWYSEYEHGREEMLKAARAILDEADVVITYNGKTFDIPWINSELWVEGIDSPSPYAHIDLYQIIKGKFRLFSRKLDYAVLRRLDDRKVTHTGFKMWGDCLIGNEEEKRKAWALMKRYGKKDTALLFPLYDSVKPWITTGHPNRALLDGVSDGCPVCSSTDRQKRGFAYTGISKFQQYVCNNCGKWYRGGQRLATVEMR